MKKILLSLLLFGMIRFMNAQTFTEENNRFAFDMLSILNDQNKNVFYSPYSISTALFMTTAGARNQTEKQMLEVLHLEKNSKEFHKKFGESIEKIGIKKSVELKIANSIWPQKGFVLKTEFLNILKSAYKVQVTECDFAKNPNIEAQVINKWVEDKTKNKIKDIIKPDLLDASTKLVLVNAIYFYGEWKTAFNKDKNTTDPFYKNDGTSDPVTFMNEAYSMDYASDELFKLISIPYKNNEVSLMIFLPIQKDSFKLAINSLDFRRYISLTKQLQSHKINLSLPKFKVETKYELEKKLPELGMTDAFTSKADFSGISDDKSLYISKVIHQAFIDVSEKGTEAAASTVVVVSRNGGASNPIAFKADHPFIYMIRDNASGQLLFIGIMNNPKG